MVTNGPSAAQHVRESAERHVLAVFDAERVCSTVFRGNGIRAGSAAFFDPQICPSMWERANAVMHHLQTSHEIEYVDRTAPGTAPYDPDDAEMRSAVFVHFVNDPNVLFVFRDRAERLSWLWGAAWKRGDAMSPKPSAVQATPDRPHSSRRCAGNSWSALKGADHAMSTWTTSP